MRPDADLTTAGVGLEKVGDCPEIHLRGSRPPSNAGLQQAYVANLLILIGIAVAVTLQACRSGGLGPIG
jgi:hypothetical protein